MNNPLTLRLEFAIRRWCCQSRLLRKERGTLEHDGKIEVELLEWNEKSTRRIMSTPLLFILSIKIKILFYMFVLFKNIFFWKIDFCFRFCRILIEILSDRRNEIRNWFFLIFFDRETFFFVESIRSKPETSTPPKAK